MDEKQQSSTDIAKQSPFTDRTNSDYARDQYFTERKSTTKRLPPWLDHFNLKDLKILFKSSIAVWITTLLIFIIPTLRVLGQAAFFGCIVLFIVPPSGIVFVHILAGITIIVGLLLGWAWGALTMKAALSARPATDLQAQYIALQQAGSRNTTNVGQASGQTQWLQIAIYEGYMLDSRVTITYFCMLGLFIYLVARLRVAAPKLTLIAMFAMIVADIYLVIAPLIPTFQGTIPKTMIIPCAVAVGIGAVCNIIFFPRSTSHIVLDSIYDILLPMDSLIKATAFKFSNPSMTMDLTALAEVKGSVAAAYKGFEGAITFLPLDFSVGRFGAEDIITLQGPLRELFVAFNELLQLHIAREEHIVHDKDMSQLAKAFSGVDFQGVGHHQINKAIDLRSELRHPETDALIAKSYAALSTSSHDVIEATQDALEAILQCIYTANNHRFSRKNTSEQRSSIIQEHLEIARRLEKSKTSYADEMARQIYSVHEHHFDGNGNIINSGEQPPPMSGLMMSVLWQERLYNFSTAFIAMLSKTNSLERSRENNRFWMPKGLQRLFSWALKKDSVPGVGMPDDLEQILTKTTTSKTTDSKKRIKKNRKSKAEKPDTDRPTTESQLHEMRHRTGRRRTTSSRILIATLNWLSNTEGLFALRVLVITIVLALPAVLRSSAGFYYREKAMWALIMAQLGLVPYTSDFISGVIIRVAGTVVGGIIGLVCWYIGSGSGPGNPYGLAAIMAVAIVFFMWWRLFSPPEHMAAGIMLASTTYMVVAYSYVDTHIPSYGNPGVGYSIFWRRVLLVLVGFAVATIVMFVPYPPSGSKHYRKILSDSMSNVKDQYALFASNWKDPPEDFVEVVEKEGIAAGVTLLESIQPIKLTKYEFSRSNIDSSTINQTVQLCMKMNQATTQLLLYTAKLPMDLRERFIARSGATDDSLMSEFMAVITLAQQSLISGDPLPALLPTPLLGRSTLFVRPVTGASDDKLAVGRNLNDEGVRKYVSAVNAFVQLLSSIDELIIVIKKAVGETSDVRLYHTPINVA